MERLKKMRYDEFMEGFKFISERVKEMYRLITNGGDAELDLKDHLAPFTEGVMY
jgi:structural maintenance of chromosome 4